MKAFLLVAGVLCGLLGCSGVLRAEEKNGVSVTVTKKTLERNDTRSPSTYYADRIDRTQGLKVTIRNTSIKAEPEGEVKWIILVRQYSSPTMLQGSTGTEKLKELAASETVEMVLGAAQVTGYKDGYDAAKDKMEYQIIVNQDGAEKVRIQSTAGFDALAKRARFTKADGTTAPLVTPENPVAKTPPATPKPAKPAIAAATPKPAAPVPANPFAAPRATPAPAAKLSPEQDAPLDGSKLK